MMELHHMMLFHHNFFFWYDDSPASFWWFIILILDDQKQILMYSYVSEFCYTINCNFAYSCWNLKKSGGTVWFHWMKLSERMECKHFDSIGLTVCMVEGTESGAWIYNTKIHRNWAAFPNWLNLINSRKVKGKDEMIVFGTETLWNLNI